MDTENLAGKYFEKIQSSERDKGKDLALFYWECFNKEFNKSDLAIFRKAANLYDWKIVFKAILDLATSSTFNPDGNVSGLLFYLCKKYFFEAAPTIEYKSADEWRKRLDDFRRASTSNSAE